MASLYKSVRWSTGSAGHEFGKNKETISANLHKTGQLPGEDGKFSTRQIIIAIFGDVTIEKARLVREQADKAARENAQAGHSLVDIEAVKSYFVDLAVTVRQLILASAMPKVEQDELLNDFAESFNAHTITEKLFPQS